MLEFGVWYRVNVYFGGVAAVFDQSSFEADCQGVDAVVLDGNADFLKVLGRSCLYTGLIDADAAALDGTANTQKALGRSRSLRDISGPLRTARSR
ncbi:hypothetical protein AB2S56_000395 [Haloparvum sp. AD34]